MIDNTWKMREVVRKLEMTQSRIDRIVSFLNKRIEGENVSDELLRSLSSPTEEIEWRVEGIMQNLTSEQE